MTYEDTRRDVSTYPQTADTVSVGSQAAYNPHQDFVNQVFAPPPGFHGVNAGLFNIGTTDTGSFTFGINLGIARIQPRIGADMGISAGVGPRGILGPDLDVTALRVDRNGLHTGVREQSTVFGVAGQDVNVGAGIGRYTGVHGHAGAYVGPVDADAGARGWVDPYGVHARAYQQVNVAGLAGERTSARADLGARTGAGANAEAFVGPVDARAGGHAYLDQNGFDSGSGGHVRVGNVAGVYGGERVALNNSNSEVSARGGAYVGAAGVETGAGVYSDGNTTVRPDVYASGHYYGQRGTAELNPPRYAQPGYPAPTADAVSSFSNWARQDVVAHSVYTVQPGQNTYRDVAAAIAPGADEQYLQQSERYLKYINHNHQLRPGEQIATLKAEHVDLRVRQMTAQHFGWQMPTS